MRAVTEKDPLIQDEEVGAHIPQEEKRSGMFITYRVAAAAGLMWLGSLSFAARTVTPSRKTETNDLITTMSKTNPSAKQLRAEPLGEILF
jgi:hypothetical protein